MTVESHKKLLSPHNMVSAPVPPGALTSRREFCAFMGRDRSGMQSDIRFRQTNMIQARLQLQINRRKYDNLMGNHTPSQRTGPVLRCIL